MLERAFAQASAPGGFFEQTRQSGVLEHAFAQASAPGGFFEQTRKSGILDHQFARASERPEVKGVKNDGTQDTVQCSHTEACGSTIQRRLRGF